MIGEIGLLRQVAHGGAWLHEALAPVGLDEARGDLEQGGFARAVAADEAGALAGGNREVRAHDQGRAAEGESRILEGQKRRKCHSWSPDTSQAQMQDR
jgi:hypothetical protein